MRECAICLALCSMLFAVSVPAEAQQPEKVFRIGFLSTASPSSASFRTQPFQQSLRQLGYVEGKNIVIVYRYAEGKRDRLPVLAAELARLKVDVIVSAGPANNEIPNSKSETNSNDQKAENSKRAFGIWNFGLGVSVSFGPRVRFRYSDFEFCLSKIGLTIPPNVLARAVNAIWAHTWT